MAKTAKKLSVKQIKFIDAYMGEAKGNATEAARMAGYKGNDNTLAQTGTQNIRKPNILEEIERLQKGSPLIASREDRQQFWTSVMRSSKEEMKDRLKASELLGKSGADFVQRVQHEGEIDLGVVFPEDAED